MRGNGGVLEYIESKLEEKGSCVLVCAEGAGHERYGKVDIGRFILDEVKYYFKDTSRDVTTKYLDPYALLISTPMSVLSVYPLCQNGEKGT